MDEGPEHILDDENTIEYEFRHSNEGADVLSNETTLNVTEMSNNSGKLPIQFQVFAP